MVELFSARSIKTSLDSIRQGSAGLDAHRTAMLNRVPNTGDWAKFPCEHLSMKDLAYLTAKTGHEFAILRGKHEDILFHGDSYRCSFDGVLNDMIRSKRLIIYGHSHPGENIPRPSTQDRLALKEIGQAESRLISGLTGYEVTYTSDQFEPM